METIRATPKPLALRLAAVVAVLFGIATVFSGGRVLFGPESARIAAGEIVPFVLWFNFVAGFAYVVAGIGLWRGSPSAARLSVAIAALTALVYLAFGVHVVLGTAHELGTVLAMTFRTGLWAAIAWLGCKHIGCRKARA